MGMRKARYCMRGVLWDGVVVNLSFARICYMRLKGLGLISLLQVWELHMAERRRKVLEVEMRFTSTLQLVRESSDLVAVIDNCKSYHPGGVLVLSREG